MYYYMFILLCFCDFGDAAVLPEKEAVILNYEYKNFGNGEYSFSYVTSNGIVRKESGKLVTDDQSEPHTAVQGYYGFTDLNGNSKLFMYTADKNGYQVQPMDPANFPLSQDGPVMQIVQAPVAPQLASLLGR